ncbi:MAG TPA: hydrogenase maturation protease [Candidatus Binataceae bacterium]|nr:hydrogenase maturation protease [Candidatus Binataceae bacterium]
MSATHRPNLFVAAIGNPDRGDDGVGRAIARELRQRVRGVRILECGGDVLELIDEWAGYGAAILIDASGPAGDPGRIRRIDLVNSLLPADFSQNSTHAFGLAETIELARALGQLPRHLIVYLVEGERFEIGGSLSPQVAGAVGKAAEAILAEFSKVSPDKPD